jgi:SM-20-related protein
VTPWREISIDSKEIFVFDGIISEKDHSTFARSVSLLPCQKTEVDSLALPTQYSSWGCHLTKKDALRLLVVARIIEIARNSFPEEKHLLKSAHFTWISPGDTAFPHRDCPKDIGDITAIYFANDVWDKSWGGETIFFNSRRDALFAVTPVPRRLILFRGCVYHRVGIPSQHSRKTRITFALKFRRVRPS